jgi:hypothetical protein
LLALVSVCTLVLTPLAVTPAAAVTAEHWGQSPYYPECSEGPCRIVLIADKTGDAAFQGQIKRWIVWMNYVRVTYNLNFPGFLYVGPSEGLRPDPGCATAPGFISVCRSDAIVNADCGSDPVVIRCSLFNVELDVGHILSARSSVRPRPLDAADTWTMVCAQLGHAIGLPESSNGASCMSSPFVLGTGQEKYYVTDDWLFLFSAYGHPAID